MRCSIPRQRCQCVVVQKSSLRWLKLLGEVEENWSGMLGSYEIGQRTGRRTTG